jgi:hypothetical protein
MLLPMLPDLLGDGLHGERRCAAGYDEGTIVRQQYALSWSVVWQIAPLDGLTVKVSGTGDPVVTPEGPVCIGTRRGSSRAGGSTVPLKPHPSPVRYRAFGVAIIFVVSLLM